MSIPHPIPEVRTDLLCRRCGYNLRTLAHDKSCPECGASVAWSIKGWKLRYANPQWVLQLKRGADAMFFASLFLTLSILLLFLNLLPIVNASSAVPAVSCGCGFLLLMLRAVWLLAAPEPFVGGQVPQLLRRIVRGAGVTLLSLSVILIARHVAPLELRIALFSLLRFSTWFVLPFAVVVLLLLLRHLSSITRRMPESEADRSVRTLFFSLIMMLLTLLPAVFLISAAGDMCVAFFGFFCMAPLLLTGYAIAMIIVSNNLARELHHIAYSDREPPWP